MKTLQSFSFLSLVLLIALSFFACEKEKAATEVYPEQEKTQKQAPAKQAEAEAVLPDAETVKLCAAFIPPWGDGDWREWWLSNMEDGEKWFAGVHTNMKKVDISVLPRCTHLSSIFAGFAPLTDFEPFRNLKNLKRLDVRFTFEITDLSPLASLNKLEYLNIWGTSISDLKPITGLKSLKEINARMTKISDLEPLAAMTGLEKIDLLKCPVKDIRPLVKLPKMSKILICNTEVADLSPLLPIADRVKELDLCNTPFRDFEMLKRFKNMEFLRIWGLPVNDFSLISSLTKLTELDITLTPAKSLKPLYGMKVLKKLTIKEGQYDEKALDAIKQAIPGLEIEELEGIQ